MAGGTIFLAIVGLIALLAGACELAARFGARASDCEPGGVHGDIPAPIAESDLGRLRELGL